MGTWNSKVTARFRLEYVSKFPSHCVHKLALFQDKYRV